MLIAKLQRQRRKFRHLEAALDTIKENWHREKLSWAHHLFDCVVQLHLMLDVEDNLEQMHQVCRRGGYRTVGALDGMVLVTKRLIQHARVVRDNGQVKLDSAAPSLPGRLVNPTPAEVAAAIFLRVHEE